MMQYEQILNLTQHQASKEQVEAGVVEPDDKDAVKALLTFDSAPSAEEIEERARKLVQIAGYHAGTAGFLVLIGGAPYLMAALERHLRASQYAPVYSFSERNVVEQVQPDGSTRKVAVFRHTAFVHPPA